MPYDPVKATMFYLLSGLLDAFDGWAARRFNQGKNQLENLHHIAMFNDLHIIIYHFIGTSFGAVLDMVTDRSVLLLGHTNCCWVQ